MEPQIIDYYNEIPNGINVIDKMNEELSELQKKYSDLEKKINKFKTPFIHVETKEEYKKYEDIICNQFKNKINEFLKDEETGLINVMNKEWTSFRNFQENPWSMYGIFMNSWWNYKCKNEDTCMEQIINELNKITKNVNKEWCELRINISFEEILKCYLEYGDELDYCITEGIINHIFNEQNGQDIYLPQLYNDSCNLYSDLECDSLSDIISYNCKICGKLDNYNSSLLCVECSLD